MQWKPEYETGISEIDGQHRTIIQMVTEVEAAVSTDMDWNGLSHLITRAKEYSKFHFSVEESLMQVFNYPRLRAHRGEHRYILRRVEDIEGRVLRTNEREGLLQGFRTWVLGHFRESDRHFAEFMRSVAPVGMVETAPVDAAAAPPGTDTREHGRRRAVGLEQKPSANTNNRETGGMDWIASDLLVATTSAAIDADHRQLVQLFNGLADAVTAGRGEGECARLLDEIISETRKHFAFEEQLMQERDYPNAAEHEAEHAQLIEQLLKYKVKFLSGFSESHLPLIHFPEDWLTRHIARMDNALVEFLDQAR